MNYLVLGVWHDWRGNQVCTHSEEMHLGFVSTEDNAEEIIDNLCASGLCEVFVFKSAQNYGSAPELVAHWTGADGYFGNESEDERLQEHEWHGRGIHSP